MLGTLQTDRPETVRFATDFLSAYGCADAAGDLTAWLEMRENSANEEIALDNLSKSADM